MDDQDVETIVATSIEELLKQNTTIEDFNMLNMPSITMTETGQGIKHITKGLLENSSIRKLYISDLDDIGIIEISKVIENKENIESLHLSGSDFYSIPEETVMKMAEILKNNTYLKLLSMNSCYLGSTKAKIILDALQTNTKLEYLSLDANRIGTEGAPAIAQFLRRNTVLRTLQMDGNNIQHQGALEILNGLQSNFTLLTFEFYNKYIDDFNMIIQRNRNLMKTVLKEVRKYMLNLHKTFPEDGFEREAIRFYRVFFEIKKNQLLNE